MTKLSKEDWEKLYRGEEIMYEDGTGVYVKKPTCEGMWEWIEAYANQQREVERKKNITECIRLRKSLKGVGGETELLATAIVNQIMRYIKLSSNIN